MNELIVDHFCGGGGASEGILLATGHSPDIAVNHDPAAVLMHQTNHLETVHYTENVWDVNPRKVCAGRPVGLAWFSPDCKHFSKAKGTTPVDKHIRGLAWLAVYWAKTVRPRVILLENVEEFQTWGPLGADNRPDIGKRGRTFHSFINALRAQGYTVDWRELRACDYGAPTVRKRFYLIARRDGRPIIWPEPTHGDPDGIQVRAGILKPWRPAAEIIDWTIPCPSIFERKRPLAENTLRRIARGIQKFVVEEPEPFIVPHREEIMAPILTQYHSYDDTPRGQTLNNPLLTVDASNRYALTVAFMQKYYAGGYTGPGADVRSPLPTVTAIDHNALTTAFLTKFYGTSIGSDMRTPLPTVTSKSQHIGEVRAFLLKYYGQGVGQSVTRPLDTVTARDRFGLITIHGEPWKIADIGLRMLTPRELFDAQGFPHDYIIDHDYEGRTYPKSQQVARCGNAVCPPVAAALVRANVPEMCEKQAREA